MDIVWPEPWLSAQIRKDQELIRSTTETKTEEE